MKNFIYLLTNLPKAKSLLLGLLILFGYSLSSNAQCITIADCQDLTFDLEQGQCETAFPMPITIQDACGPQAIEFLQSNDLATFEASPDLCSSGDNHYYRVYDLVSMGQETDFNASSVNIGVFSSLANTVVEANIYTLSGNLFGGELTLVGSGSLTLGVPVNGEMVSIPLTAEVPSNEVMVVEVVTPGELFAGQVMATNTLGEMGQSYYSSASCGSGIVAMTDQLLLTVAGESEGYKVEQVDGSGLTHGDPFPIGITNQNYEVTDVNGNVVSCSYLVTVNGFQSTITSMACNNLVQVSLDENCEAFVTADDILKGESYSCFTDYEIHIIDQNGVDIGNHLTSDHVGQQLEVTVVSPTGNSCWGEVLVEDKVGPELNCEDAYTSCDGSTDPGANVASTVSFSANQSGSISDGAPNEVVVTIPVFGLVDATINDVNVELDIEHSDVSNLKVSLKSPDGTLITLFENATSGNVNPNCTRDNLDVILDDEAVAVNTEILGDCQEDVYAIDGKYKSKDALSAFDNLDPNGDWELIIADLVNGDGGMLVDVNLVIGQQGAKIKLPIPADATYVRSGDFSYTVTGLDLCGKATLTYNDNPIEQDCSSDFTDIIERSWVAVDEQGNTSVSCVQIIYVNRTGVSDIMWPRNYDGHDLNVLSCRLYKDNVPEPSVTGYPKPQSGNFCDNVQIFPHIDTRIDICESSYKILRYWKVLEWCTGEILEFTQIIKVLDDDINIVCPQEEIEATEGTFSCSGFVTLPKPTVLNECSGWWYEVKWFKNPSDPVATDIGVTYNSSTDLYMIEGLREGINIIEYTAIDSCGNEDVCTVEVNVEDNIIPTAVCDEFTSVSIAADMKAVVNAITFDNGSTDNCGIVSYDARKMTNSCSGTNTQFNEQLIFCCSEIGTNVMVEFRVTDAAGNTNSCMVEVTVEDKLPPYITKCPANIELNCTEDYTDVAITGEPEYIDNCSVVSVSYKDNVNIDNCGVGKVTRVWTVEDAAGLKGSCTQVITIVDDQPFREIDIIWPSDHEANGCEDSLHPDDLPTSNGYPRFKKEDACNLVASSYKDQRFDISDGSCVKILRTWTVIDWCTYNDENPNDPDAEGIWTRTQIIKLLNKEAPIFVSCNSFDVCGYVDCTEDPLITLNQSANDDCTAKEELFWSYKIDLWRDGSVNIAGSDSTVTTKMPYGDHSIEWIVGDKCGNVTRCTQNFTVKDCKKPTPYCYGSVVTTVMNNNGMVEIWASDYDIGAFDNCTAQEDLIFSFSQSTSQSAQKKTFTCDDIPDGEEAMIPVNIWVIDEEGNKDYCEVLLRLQDNESDFCDPIDGGLISGLIMTEEQEMIGNAFVSYTGNINEVNGEMITDVDGQYSFNVELDMDYSIGVEKSDDPMNGVSTLDLLLIQRHILKLKELDSPYKIIAADIDDNHKINANDLIKLRKLILGKISEFPGTQKEWRFVERDFVFSDVKNPFPYKETIDIDAMNTNMNEQHFYGVKIGDVNNDLSVNATSSNVVARFDESIELYADFAEFNANNEIQVPVKLKDLAEFKGIQFTIGFDTETMDFVDIAGGKLVINESNVGLNYEEKGKVLFSWNDINADDFKKDDVLFTLIFNAKLSGSLDQVLSINSDITKSEAYSSSLEPKNVAFDIDVTSSTDVAVLYQNNPNPFKNETNIKFYLPESSQASLIIYDLAGKVLKKINGNYKKGMNEVKIDLNDININGLLYYQIEADEFSAIKKMIIVR